LASKLLHDVTGSVLVEYTIVFPLFIVLVLGTVDVTYMFFDWSLANKAAYIGARTAVVLDPVDPTVKTYDTVTSPPYPSGVEIGQLCFDRTNSTTFTPSGFCPSNLSYSCAGTDICSTSQAFTDIFSPMQAIFPRLQKANVNITYQTNGLGFAGGLSWRVAVSVQGMTHQFYFIDTAIKFLAKGISVIGKVQQIPTFTTTLTSEDFCSIARHAC
jgi:hypothetical protein